VKIPKNMLTDDWKSVVNDPGIDIIVETIGGIEPAKSIQMTALKNGRTCHANKKMLASEGKISSPWRLTEPQSRVPRHFVGPAIP